MSIDSKVFDKNYYYNICLGSDEFKNSGGLRLHARVKKIIDSLPFKKTMNVLEIGCGRGDTSLYIAKKVNYVTGIDYSSAAIKISKSIQKKYPEKIQERSKFLVMDATKLSFPDDSFDFVLLIDTIDHLDSIEIKKMFREISRILKKDGFLFVRTCTNRILLTRVYPYYIYPLNKLLTYMDKKIKRIEYKSLAKNPRTLEQEVQHINEPDYFSLKSLFNQFKFRGKINGEIGFLKEITGLRSKIYNFMVTLSPISKYFPLNIFFIGSFTCLLKNKK